MAASPASAAGFLDQEYYDDMVAAPFRDGTIAEAPVMPGTGLFMPAGSAALKDKGLFRRNVPEFVADLCTGCMECALVCPDAAIPNTVHDIHELLDDGDPRARRRRPQQEALRNHFFALSRGGSGVYRASKEPQAVPRVVAEAAGGIATENATLRRNFMRLAEALSAYPVAKTRPFFDAMEKANPGSGGLFAAAIDPWKCSGCLECIDVCGPGALVARDQDAALLETLQARFEFLSKTPNTPPRFTEDATKPNGDIKRLMLDRGNYYATTGGHGACRGCGEVTSIRLVTSANHAIHDRRRREHVRELEGLIDNLAGKLTTVGKDDSARRARITSTLETLEKRLYTFESGPSGNGPASAVVANATGCSSVYASTFPFNPYNDPWVNSLFQDAQPLAKGIFEGLTAAAVDDVRALRIARLELEDAYEPATHDPYFRYLSWPQFTPEELGLLPTVMTIGGDGATYDIGFGALSRLLATRTPVKVMVLNSGAYSNTGGQASTASFLGQDSDLSRFGAAHSGKQEDRKELGLIAAFHPNVFVVQSSTALQGHFLKNVMEYLTYNDSPGGARRLHALPGRARHRRRAGEPPRAPVGGKPDEPGIRARSAARLQHPQLVQPRRQPRRGQGLGHRQPGIRRCRRLGQAAGISGDSGRLRDWREPVQEALQEAEGRRRGPAGERVHRPLRGRARRQDRVRVVDRRRQAPDPPVGVGDHRPPGPGAPQILAHPAVPCRQGRGEAGCRPCRRVGGVEGAVCRSR